MARNMSAQCVQNSTPMLAGLLDIICKNGEIYKVIFSREHDINPLPKEEPLKGVLCPICEAVFQYKGQREIHLKTCKKDISKIRNLMGFKVDDVTTVNRWLWPKPVIF